MKKLLTYSLIALVGIALIAYTYTKVQQQQKKANPQENTFWQEPSQAWEIETGPQAFTQPQKQPAKKAPATQHELIHIGQTHGEN